MGNDYCTHCDMSGHWVDKCWKLHPQLCPKHGKEVVKAPITKKVGDERVGKELTLQEASHEESNLSKEDSISTQESKENNLLEWIGTKWIACLYN